MGRHWWYSDNPPHPSKRTIAECMGVHASTVRRRIAAMEQGVFITRVERWDANQGQLSNAYHFDGLIREATRTPRKLRPCGRRCKGMTKKDERADARHRRAKCEDARKGRGSRGRIPVKADSSCVILKLTVKDTRGMRRPYIQKTSWPDFFHGKQSYSLRHLDEYTFSVEDGQGIVRQVIVTFSDHCFTRKCPDNADPTLIYPASSRESGCFCFDRYGHSLHLLRHIEQASKGKVWNAGDGDYSIVPTVKRAGRKLLYNVVFILQPVTGLPVGLHMSIKTAHPYEQGTPTTFGEVRFKQLVTLRMQKKHPKKRWGGRRRRPTVS